jgi:hypothetical protein
MMVNSDAAFTNNPLAFTYVLLTIHMHELT